MLSVSKLSFGYTQLPLFSDLSFAVAGGQLIHLKGPNGAGKSTLLSILAGLLQPRSGLVSRDDGIKSEYLPAEGNGHYLRLDARQNLSFWLRLHGERLTEDRLRAELDFWRLSPLVIDNHVPVEQFSTGMKRKLALARIRLSGAQLWLLDEPVSGLDDYALQQFRLMLSQHLNSGGAAIVISHDLAPLQSLAITTIEMGI